ncbi:7,8-didemethyl-8-hydroxy-5-deazariboflavin synthase subunit CofH [Halobacteriales archaeon QH_1_68_42]|nr:MAG: 7,8-didemethyl-8-hydroxy-5-deazariboflavin synthase subunit CofH [Halobacteriales archaeon QH_1_68_42]
MAGPRRRRRSRQGPPRPPTTDGFGRQPASLLRGEFGFDHRPETDQSFENALAKARDGQRLSVADGIELITTGTDRPGIDRQRKELVLEAADRRRAETVGDEVTFVANLNNNVTTACNTGCLFCNFKDRSEKFRSANDESHGGFTKTPAESRQIVASALERGIYEVCSVSGLHPAFALDAEHREILEASDRGDLNYRPPAEYGTDPATYCEQIRAMNVGGVHVHSMTPEEAYHARRGTDWSYEEVFERLQAAGLDSVPGTAAEILVDEVRDVICPGKIDTGEWLEAMEAAANVGLDTTATRNTPLHERGMVDAGATTDEDELMIAVSRLFLDNIEHIQSSWVKYGDEQGLKMLSCGADDFMGTILSEEITKRAGGEFGQYRSVSEYVEMIDAIGRTPVERSTDYRERRRIDPDDTAHGPELGPKADGTPLVE